MCTMLLIPLIPIVALVTQNMIILNNIIVRKADLKVRLYVSLLFQFIILLQCKSGLNVFLLSLVYRQTVLSDWNHQHSCNHHSKNIF